MQLWYNVCRAWNVLDEITWDDNFDQSSFSDIWSNINGK